MQTILDRVLAARLNSTQSVDSARGPGVLARFFGEPDRPTRYIDLTALAVERTGERAFGLTNEKWLEPATQNRENLAYFMNQLGDALGLADDKVKNAAGE